MSGASERANERASGPVLQSVFLAVFYHSERELYKLGVWVDGSSSETIPDTKGRHCEIRKDMIR